MHRAAKPSSQQLSWVGPSMPGAQWLGLAQPRNPGSPKFSESHSKKEKRWFLAEARCDPFELYSNQCRKNHVLFKALFQTLWVYMKILSLADILRKDLCFKFFKANSKSSWVNAGKLLQPFPWKVQEFRPYCFFYNGVLATLSKGYWVGHGGNINKDGQNIGQKG